MRTATLAAFVAGLLLHASVALAHRPDQPPHQQYRIGDLTLESGEVIKDFAISYVTHGTLNAQKSNAILMVTAISGNHHRLDFLIGPGKALDPTKYFIVCTDAIGHGIRLWRDILGFLAARSPEMYRYQFQNQADVLSWLKTQEDAQIPLFDANDWIYQTWAYDAHDVGTTPGMNGDYVKALRAIKAKTLILTGQKDLLNPEWEPLEASRYIRDVRYVTISPQTITGHASAGGFFPADVDFLNFEIAAFLDVVSAARLR